VRALRPATEARPYPLVRDVQREQVHVESPPLEPETKVDALLRRHVTRVGGIRATAAGDGCIAVLPPIVDARIGLRGTDLKVDPCAEVQRLRRLRKLLAVRRNDEVAGARGGAPLGWSGERLPTLW